MALDPERHPIVRMAPARLTRHTAWAEHIPFAFWLTAALRPALIVELGVFHGDSYLAFCQAVAALGLPARCFGVDTWRGDPHAGPCGPEVLAALRAHHDPRYGAFSTLVQATFDAARSLVPDGIDLLHIDGYHTYGAVRHDFERWLPKMSRRGVVLLHDTRVRLGDFGVWRLWQELAPLYPSFEFAHGFGLGVLAVGPEQPEEVRALLEASGEEAERVRRFFAELGARLRPTE